MMISDVMDQLRGKRSQRSFTPSCFVLETACLVILKSLEGGMVAQLSSSVNSEAHDRSDAVPNAAQHVGVVGLPFVFAHTSSPE